MFNFLGRGLFISPQTEIFITWLGLVIVEARLEILFCLEFERREFYLAIPYGMSPSNVRGR